MRTKQHTGEGVAFWRPFSTTTLLLKDNYRANPGYGVEDAR